MEYSSKNIDYMTRLKKAVYHGAAHHPPEEQHRIWETVRKQVTMEDLRLYAIQELERPALFPPVSCHRDVVVVFNKPPMDDELDMLHKMLGRLNVHEDRVYVTQFYKVATESTDEFHLLERLLRSEIGIIAPTHILTFGSPLGNAPHVLQDYSGAHLVDSIPLVFPEDPEAAKRQKMAVWHDAQLVFSTSKVSV